jgi:NAD(P)-dependent dehydrogenase (short-subunit alcohol dehydrogenase family)
MPEARENENADALQSNMTIGSLCSVKDKVVVISGGGSGIGAMLASGFAQNGSSVYVFSRKDASAFAADVTRKGPGTCTAIQADLQKDDSVSAAVAFIHQREGRVDVLINNAGTNYNASLQDTPTKMFGKVLEVNVTGIFRAVQKFEPLLLAAPPPARIINISSINGMEPPVLLDTYAYSSSKAAVLMLTRHLAARLSPSILVNSISPGPFHSIAYK